ncbi:hypothetical protein MGH68_15095 [Erysipelothrix sp. D19-032]
MAIAKQSYLEDILAGFDLLMIDPTKDPFEVGKVIPLEAVIDMTVELIEYCESERVQRGLPKLHMRLVPKKQMVASQAQSAMKNSSKH